MLVKFERYDEMPNSISKYICSRLVLYCLLYYLVQNYEDLYFLHNHAYLYVRTKKCVYERSRQIHHHNEWKTL